MRQRDQFIDTEGARLRVRVAGEGPAVVLVHGWALDLDMWHAQFEALTDRYRLIAFDRRGFGFSSGTPGISHDVDDVEHLLTVLDIDRAAIVGMSQGARVALRWAMRHRRRAICLVLDAPPRESPAPEGAATEIPLAHYRALVKREGIEAFRRRWLEHPFTRLHTNAASAHLLLKEMVRRYPAKDLMANRLPRLTRVNTLHDFQLPTLIINGAWDSEERRVAGAQLARTLPSARQALVPDAGHLAALDNPHVYNDVLDEFLASQPALAAGSHRSPRHRSSVACQTK